ncbi:MAG: formylglycine-generating enzyme family protein [Planctomycetota bacterium]
MAQRLPDSPAEAPRFADERDQFLHDNLARLVAGLTGFAGPQGRIAEVERRRDWAATIVRRTVEDHEALWNRARTELEGDERFAGFELRPQVGLVPLGPDPDTGLQEFAHLRTGEVPVRRADGRIEFSERTGLVFVLLPGGRVRVGAQAADPDGPNYDPEAEPIEGPVHEVALAPFFLSKYEMSQAQWERFTGSNPSLYKAGTIAGGAPMTPANPVEAVSWDDGQSVLGRLGLLLPTEAQWEYACRAGTDTPWPTGEDRKSLAGYANISDERTWKAGYLPRGAAYEKDFVDDYACHAPVEALLPNRFGLHQMIGNVAEWCREDVTGYDVAPREGDGLRPPVRTTRIRAMRGGAYAGNASIGRVALRARAPAHFRSSSLGLRPSRAVD